MTKIDRERLDPISFAAEVLDPLRLVCAFVNSGDEKYRVFDPFVVAGLAPDEDQLLDSRRVSPRRSLLLPLRDGSRTIRAACSTRTAPQTGAMTMQAMAESLMLLLIEAKAAPGARQTAPPGRAHAEPGPYRIVIRGALHIGDVSHGS